MAKRTKIIISISFITLFFFLLISPRIFFPLMTLKVSPGAGLPNIKDNTPAIVDKLTFRFKKLQKGDLILYRRFGSLSPNFQRVYSVEKEGVYVKGDTWGPEMPPVFVHKDEIIGKLILISFSHPNPFLYFYPFLLILFLFLFLSSLLYLLQVIKDKPFKLTNYLKAFLWWIIILVLFIPLPDLFIHLFVPDIETFYSSPPQWYFDLQKIFPITGFILATLFSLWRFSLYLRKKS